MNAMSPGLRQRNRLTAMRLIQEKALDLFDTHGFDSTTIEEIASAAQVSPSTVYRYFGTKEGLVVSDEFDSLTPEALAALIDVDDIIGTFRRVVSSYEPSLEPKADGSSLARRRVHYFFQVPSVRRAAFAALDRASARITEVLVQHHGLAPVQARVIAHAIVFGYFAALEQWHLDGGERPIRDYVEEGLQALWGDHRTGVTAP